MAYKMIALQLTIWSEFEVSNRCDPSHCAHDVSILIDHAQVPDAPATLRDGGGRPFFGLPTTCRIFFATRSKALIEIKQV
ncbi:MULTISPECIES: hypothetical protein [unclassified Bradyrhizobium]|uniref:hypothetical protein n=1 Tax=unclassified Bradyrhizobium TaxID=2631580 RepID=UPI0024790DFA|nr:MULTISPECIES: hypothetical protein [unclassified Bradyrhizobium]WGS19135.1 hypothetical protein MTX22_32420 [Bradyrhizobium sp. ISRA463]WGS25973.1 hypothetical protein MTX19_29970 [Bradyrhizobium sp. ISRA464]